MMNKVSFNGQKMVQRRSKNGPKTDQKWFKRGTKNGPELFGTPCILCPAFSKLLLLQQQLFCCNLGIRCPNKDSLQRLFKGQLMAIGLTLEHDKWSIGSASDGWFWTSPPFCYVKNMRRVLHRQYTEKGQKRPEKKKDHFSILLIRIISWRHCVRQTI